MKHRKKNVIAGTVNISRLNKLNLASPRWPGNSKEKSIAHSLGYIFVLFQTSLTSLISLRGFRLIILMLGLSATNSVWAGNVNYSYDDLGRLFQISYDDGTTITYSYDNVGNRTARTVVDQLSPPSAATLVSPSGSTTDTTPTYTWNAVANSTWYRLQVNDASGTPNKIWYSAADAGCASGTGTCSITSSATLPYGEVSWWVQTWNSVGTGPWSSTMKFIVSSGLKPGIATLDSPSGRILNKTPTYSWNAVSGSTWYYLLVRNDSGNVIERWYSAADAGCASGTGICSITSSVTLDYGEVSWWVRTWNSVGVGSWSSIMKFIVSSGLKPAIATLVSPGGSITDKTPTYTWNAVTDSTWYYLWVRDATGDVIKKWYTATDAGCASGIGTCSITPTTTLALGKTFWWIQTWNSVSYGDWSDDMEFLVGSGLAPTAATLVSPSGNITDSTPTYTWNAVADSTWYYLWVRDASGEVITKWYTAVNAGCASGTGTCTVTPTTALAVGSVTWKIQTWNSIAYGPWSSEVGFTLN